MATNFGPGAQPPASSPWPPQLPPSQLPPPQPANPDPRDLSGQFCPNCGAPLTAAEGRACKFCGASLMPYFASQVVRALADFGLNDRQRHPRPAATGFSPCQAWTEIDAPRSGSTIPAVCFAVNDTEITHYKLTWARLQPGQTISLYMPS